MNEQEYNNAEGIRRSDLWKIEESPEKFKWNLDHPFEPTAAMAFGSACHKLILEPDDFGNEYVVAPKFDRRSKEGKAAFEAFALENAGKEYITEEQFGVMQEMRDALNRNPLAKKLMSGKGESEKAFFWTDPETKEKCKIKTDRMVTYNRRKYVIDYKTTVSADTNRFNSEIWKRGYYFQAGMYSEGVMRALKLKKRPGFLFVAQEKDPPYAVNVIEVTEEVMQAGVIKFHELMDKYHQCKVLDVWPGYVLDVPNDAFVPNWYQEAAEEDA